MPMKNSEILLSRRLDDKYRILKEQTVLKLLRYLLLKNNMDKYDELNKLLNFRKRIITAIENDHRWQYTANGFINISNYSYDNDEMTFNINTILRNENGYYVDDTCTDIAHTHYNNNQNNIAELSKIDRIIHSMYLEYKHIIDPLIEQCKSIEDIKRIENKVITYLKLNTPEQNDILLEERPRNYDQSISTFVATYRKNGLNDLIRWLNECNSSKSTELLFSEIIEELGPISCTGKYSEEFYDERLMKILSLYSIRGDYLRDLYILQKRKQEELGLSKKMNQ